MADDDHLNGGMIALMPTAEDAARLAVKGGETAEDLHCTLYFLGDDGTSFSPAARQEIIGCLMMMFAEFPPITANIFGAAHWNAGSPKPSWVWSIGDPVPPEGPPLTAFHDVACEAVFMAAPIGVTIPAQHCPWVAHICAEYSDDLTLIKELEKRIGPVTFDRIRVSFGSEDTDIPLTGTLTAAGVPRRKLTDFEIASRADFAMIDKQWEDAVGSTLTDYARAEADQRAELREQITSVVDSGNLSLLDTLHVDTDHMADLLADHMRRLAITAGKEMQREAEHQGVTVPEWDLDTALTASTAVDIIRGVARVTARALGLGLVQSAGRRAMTFITSGRSGRQVAELVDRDLKDLSVRTPRDYIGSAMSAAQNTGRYAVLRVSPPGIYMATEVLDKRTCGPCRAIDGTEFTSLNQAAEAYPGGAGGYVNCAGGGRCRGTMIAVWGSAEVGSAAVKAVTMPWHVIKSSQCGSSKPWAVVKDSTGEVEGCHETEAQADKQMAALYAAEGGSSVGTVTETMGGKPNQGTKKDKRLKENPKAAAEISDDVKADTSTAASGLEGITLTEDGRILDAEGNEVTTPAQFADSAEDCPPGMMKDPATGECGPDPESAKAQNTATWQGPLVVEGETTGDGREFAEGALSWPDPIQPGEVLLRWNKEDSHGGTPTTKAVAVGRIDRIWRDGNKIMGEGVFDLGQPDGVEAHRRVKEKFLRGVSVDADDVKNADVELVWPESSGDGTGDDPFEMLFTQPDKAIYHGGRIRGATLCDIPAFIEAYISLTDEAGAVVAGGALTLDEVAKRQSEISVQRMKTKPHGRSLKDALVAHGGPEWKPPAEWFSNPQLSQPTTIHVTEEGRIFGHAAQWGACHIGFMDVCTQPPREDDFPYFLTGELITAAGSVVPVGQITVTTNHADLYVGAGPAKEHYENTGNAIADVTVGADRIGIWVAGAVRPNADPALVHELRASGEVSGDWRRIGGAHRLVGLLGVNVGGFVVPRMKARVASGQVQALVAAGRLTTAHEPVIVPEPMDLQTARKIVMDDLARQMTEGSE